MAGLAGSSWGFSGPEGQESPQYRLLASLLLQQQQQPNQAGMVGGIAGGLTQALQAYMLKKQRENDLADQAQLGKGIADVYNPDPATTIPESVRISPKITADNPSNSWFDYSGKQELQDAALRQAAPNVQAAMAPMLAQALMAERQNRTAAEAPPTRVQAMQLANQRQAFQAVQERAAEESARENLKLSPAYARVIAEAKNIPPPPDTPEVVAQKLKLREAGRPSTTVNVEGQQFGPIPPGMRIVKDESGAVRMEPIPGSPAEQAAAAAQEQKTVRETQTARTSDIVTEDVGRARKIIEESGNWAAGPGSLLQKIPASAAKDLSTLLDTVKANTGFDKLQQMRNASPTGGALGQVSELENRMLQSALGSLDQSQSKEQLMFTLQRVEDIYNMIVHGTASPPKRDVQGASSAIDELIRKYNP